MILVLLADGFEEIEALTPVDMLRRAGLEVVTVGVGERIATGSHGIPVVCDKTPDEVDLGAVEAVIFPGGMPGSLNLDASPFTDEAIAAVRERGGRLAAICAAPLVLGRRGLLEGKEAICYPGFEGELVGAKISARSVVTDGSITTAKGMGVALEFSKELVTLLADKATAEKLSEAIMEDTAQNTESISVNTLKISDDDDGDESLASYLNDSQFLNAVEVALTTGNISTSLLQRKLYIGYGKAATFIDVMEEMGIIGEANGQKPRDVLISTDEWREKLSRANESKKN